MRRFRLKVIILVLIGFAQMTFAQTQFRDSTEAYEYWAQRGVIEAVYAFMEDYIETVDDKTVNKAEITAKKDFYDKFIKNIESKDSLPDLNQIEDFLNNNSWKGTKNKVFTPLKKNIDKSTPLEQDFFNCTKPGEDIPVTTIPGHANKCRNWNATTNDVIDKYNKALKTLEKKTSNKFENIGVLNVPQDDEGIDAITDDAETDKEERIANQEEGSSNILIRILGIILIALCVFLIGLLFGSWLIYRLSKKRIYSILKMEKNNYLNEYSYNNKRFAFKYIEIVHILRDRKNLHKEENENIKKKLATLQDELEKQKKENKQLLEENISLGEELENKNIDNKSNISEEKTAHQEVMVTEKPEKHINKYFSMPNNDGSFNISNGDDVNDGKKYYKIKYEEASNQGELFYLSSDRDQKSINRLEALLKPVCDIENISNADKATSIELIKSGKVSLIDDKWVIDTNNKVKIKIY